MPTTRWHRIGITEFDELASGGGSADTLAELRGGQLSKRRILLRELHDQVSVRFPGTPSAACLSAGYAALAELRRAERESVDAVLTYPTVGAWLVHCLRRLERGEADRGAGPRPRHTEYDLDDDLGYFGGVVAAAACRAGRAVDVPVRLRRGTLTLPSVGRAEIGFDSAWARLRAKAGEPVAVIETQRGDVELRWSSRNERAGWFPVRSLRVPDSDWDLALEDTDPFRELGPLATTARLPDIERLQATVEQAWRLLAEEHPHRAVAIAAGVRALVPLATRTDGSGGSATSADAQGAVALRLSDDPVAMAVTLVHEYQHHKLVQLLDFAPLHDAGPAARHWAPWRGDPRPLSGLFHGSYAFLGIGEFWRERLDVLRRIPSTEADLAVAGVEFAWCRAAVSQAVYALEASGGLTELGRRFVAGMHAQVRTWSPVTVDETSADAASTLLADARAMWLLRHVRPADEFVAALARAWRRGDAPSPASPADETVVPAETASRFARSRLVRLRVADPDRFARLRPPRRPGASWSGADYRFAQGDFAGAAELYRRQLASKPDSIAAFAGLVLSLARQSSDAAVRGVYENHPECLRAVWRRVRLDGGDCPDPEALASWLAGSVPASHLPRVA